MKGTIRLALMAAVTMGLAACGSGAKQEAPAKEDEVEVVPSDAAATEDGASAEAMEAAEEAGDANASAETTEASGKAGE